MGMFASNMPFLSVLFPNVTADVLLFSRTDVFS